METQGNFGVRDAMGCWGLVRRATPLNGALLVGIAALLPLTASPRAHGTIVSYSDENQAAWWSDAGPVTTVGVPDIPLESLYQQWLPLGLNLGGAGLWGGIVPTFFEPHWSLPPGTTVFVGQGNRAVINFTQPITAFSMNWLFLVPQDITFWHGASSVGGATLQAQESGVYSMLFYGITSTQPFNQIEFWDWATYVSVWGTSMSFTTIPTPNALAVFGLSSLLARRGRRRA